MIDSVDEATKAMVAVRIGVWRICGGDGGVPKTGTDNDGIAGWNHDTPEGESENLPEGCRSREMAVVV